ncbi:MAG: hypothetical protein Tsb0014_07950 [Pleurocapsa sp.]
MKNILVAGLTLVAIATCSTPAKAEDITPINLVFRAYQGYLLDKDIPSYATFIQAAQLGQIDAEALVRGAVDKGRLSADKLEDANYLQKVEAALFKVERRK